MSNGYEVHVLTGNENIDIQSKRKTVPLSMVLAPLRNGKTIFICGMKKPTAYALKKKISPVLGSEVEVIRASVNGAAGYLFTIKLSIKD